MVTLATTALTVRGSFVLAKTISHHKVLEKIGQGGLGEVYLAEDTSQ